LTTFIDHRQVLRLGNYSRRRLPARAGPIPVQTTDNVSFSPKRCSTTSARTGHYRRPFQTEKPVVRGDHFNGQMSQRFKFRN